tara:strand:- start:441 stop:983 length:543 start_codon:yes stop_codon:yes gene_type:complete
MSFQNYDPGNTNLGVQQPYVYQNTNIENNSFLFLSEHRNNYFYDLDKKFNCKSKNYEGYFLEDLFFSDKNIEIIQRQLVLKIYKDSNKKYVIPFQNYKSLDIIMKFIFNDQAKHLPYNNQGQIRELNEKVIKEIYPSIINNLNFREFYLNEVNGERKIDQLPVNTSIKGSSTLPSIPNTF